MTPEEKKALEESKQKVKAETTPIVEQRAIPDKIPPREDVK